MAGGDGDGARQAEEDRHDWRATLIVALAVLALVHSLLVALWLAPRGPVRDVAGGSLLATYVDPYFRQSWDLLEPSAQRVDEALWVRARVRTGPQTLALTPWLDVTKADLTRTRDDVAPARVHLAGRRLATNLNNAMFALGRSGRQVVLESTVGRRGPPDRPAARRPRRPAGVVGAVRVVRRRMACRRAGLGGGTVRVRRIPGGRPMSTLWRLRDALARTRRSAERWLTAERHALHAVALARILVGLSVLGLLVTNYSTRQVWVGDASAWAEPARAVSRFPEVSLLDGVSGDLLTVVYVVVMLAAVGLVLGWRAKAMTIVVLLGFIAVTAQNPVLGSIGDNLVRLTLLWMLLMRTADVVGLVGLGAQTVLAYLAGGLDKASQPVWQQGTALYTTLQLPEFRPFPWLSDLLSNATVLLALLTWTVLAVQLFFAPMLLRRETRNLVAGVAIGVNVLFAVVLATPWSSLAVIAVTGLFVSDDRWAALGERVADLAWPVLDRTADVRYAVADRVADWWYDRVLGLWDRVRFSVFRR